MWNSLSVAHKLTQLQFRSRPAGGAAHLARRRLKTSEVSSGVKKKKKKRPTKERREDQISKVNPPENENVTTTQQLQLDICLSNKYLYPKPCSLFSNNIVLRS